MEDRFVEEDVRNRLILSGLNELFEHGLEDFSLRRAALGAQVSCAAPYRHFKGKDDYIAAIIKYMDSKWQLLAEQIEQVYDKDTSRLVIETCIANLRFRVSNKNIKAPLTVSREGREQDSIDSSISHVVARYCAERGLSDEERELREFVATSLISGAVVLASSSNLERIIALTRTKLSLEFP